MSQPIPSGVKDPVTKLPVYTVINPPQTGILGVCNLQTKFKMVGGEAKPYQAMGLSLTFDHRVVDGAPAARFMQDLCKNLENFLTLLAK